MYVLQHMPAKTRMKPAMPRVSSARIKNDSNCKRSINTKRCTSRLQESDTIMLDPWQAIKHCRSHWCQKHHQFLDNNLWEQDHYPKDYQAWRKSVQNLQRQLDDNYPAFHRNFTKTRGHQYHYLQHGKSVLLIERSIVNRAHTKMYRPLSSTQAVHRSQRYWNRLQHKRLSTRLIKQRAHPKMIRLLACILPLPDQSTTKSCLIKWTEFSEDSYSKSSI